MPCAHCPIAALPVRHDYLSDLSQYNARGMLAVLLAAQSNGLQVTVTYDINGSGLCTASKVQTQ